METPDSAPENELPPEAVMPVVVSVKSPAVLDLPLSLTTCLITVSVAGTSSFVVVQVFCSPAVMRRRPTLSRETSKPRPTGPARHQKFLSPFRQRATGT